MPKLIPLLALCAACSPTSGKRGDTGTAMTRTYATQTNAPTPDYRLLLKQTPAAGEGWRPREANRPLPPDAKSIGDAYVGFPPDAAKCA